MSKPFKKVKNQSKVVSELYDLMAIRIIVSKIEECYAVLGLVHQLYTPVQQRFKDYIATPKSNGYQSIHTTVFGQDGEMTEIQILHVLLLFWLSGPQTSLLDCYS